MNSVKKIFLKYNINDDEEFLKKLNVGNISTNINNNQVLKSIFNKYDFNKQQRSYLIKLLQQAQNEVNFNDYLLRQLNYCALKVENNGIISCIKNDNYDITNNNSTNVFIKINPICEWTTKPKGIPLQDIFGKKSFEGCLYGGDDNNNPWILFQFFGVVVKPTHYIISHHKNWNFSFLQLV